jgi:hypothetical protein
MNQGEKEKGQAKKAGFFHPFLARKPRRDARIQGGSYFACFFARSVQAKGFFHGAVPKGFSQGAIGA